MLPAPDFFDQAACRNEGDPELFFLPRNDRHTSLALAICASCPVQAACLDYALTTGQVYGIWGGVTEEDRAAMHRGART